VQVVVLLLLVLALALLVLGLIAGSTPLVAASIAASLLAAYAMVRVRRRQQDSAPAVLATATTVGGSRPSPVAETPLPAGVPSPPAHAAPEPAASVPAETAPAEDPLTETMPAPSVPAETVPVGGSEDPADSEPAVASTDPPLRSRGDEPVWVVDGRPRYHLAGCGFLLGRRPEPEPVPLRQAVEDGFTPCALCDPDTRLAAGPTAG